MRHDLILGFCFSFLTLVIASTQLSADITFNITSTGNAQADAGFQRAANFVRSQFDDDVTVNITAAFSNLAPGVLGQAGSSQGSVSYNAFRNAINLDATSAADATFAAALPQGNAFSVWINETSQATGASNQTPYLDNNQSANNTIVRLSRANAKALGLLNPNEAGEDVNITFSNAFTWDFDPSNGINAGAIDFVGVAIHEIMHGMGFFSGVDDLDFNDDGQFSEDSFRVNPADFARHSADSQAAGADIDFTADARSKYYSIDGGLTAGAPGLDHWSTGIDNGDGRQASHWRDNLGLGILDPTSEPAGSLNIVTDLDIEGLDIIGWDVIAVSVPEPNSMLMFAFGLTAFGFRRRNRS